MALSWGAKKQIIYFSVFFGAVLILASIYIGPKIKTAPSCFDGRQNGTEEGIDCGGSCPRVCAFQANPLVVRWARSFPVTSSVYNAAALIENQNPGSAARKVGYEFKLYDEAGIFIASRSGSTFIGTTGRFLVFEPSINAGNRRVAKTLFAFTELPVWEKVDRRLETFPVFVRSANLSAAASSPKLSAILVNNSVYDLSRVMAVALIYGAEGNVQAVSRTFVDRLPANSSEPIFFTWLEPLPEAVSSFEILPQLDPFNIKL